MGWESWDLRVSVRLDCHGGDQQVLDKEQYRKFLKKLKKLVDKNHNIVSM